MKKLLFILLLCPLLSTAQNSLPRFANDTLYTSGGYKIYKGQILHLANGTSEAGYFKFIKFQVSMAKNNTYTLQNSTLLVNKLKGYKYSGPDDNSIRISGTVTYKDSKKEEVDIILNFEKAISGSDGQPGELTVPEAFMNKTTSTAPVEIRKQGAAGEIKKQAVPGEMKKQATTDEIIKLMVADEIKKLFDLYKAGALTKTEYETQKKKLLEKQ
jgi:Short C-terminal domain